MKTNRKLRKFTQVSYNRPVMFFAKCFVGEIFNYSEVLTPWEIICQGAMHGVTIEYCTPNTDEYQKYGYQTCKVIGIDQKIAQNPVDKKSITEKIESGYYKNNLEYPSPLGNAFYCSNKDCLKQVDKNVNFCPNCGTDVRGMYEKIKAEYDEKKAAYNKEEGRLHLEFKLDLLDEFGLDKLPNADAIYDYAWNRGHSSGFYEIYNVMNDLAELFTPYK